MSNDSDTSTDIAALDANAVDSRMRDIVKLAHTGKMADETQYQQMQPQLLALSRRREELRSGSVAAPASSEHQPQRAVATRAEGVPDSWLGYPKLQESSQFDNIDKAAWEGALPEMHKLGLSFTQVTGLAKILETASEKALAQRNAAAESMQDARQRDTERTLRDRYGAGWRQRLADANRALTAARRHDRSIRVGDMVLSDGTRIGDHAAYVSMLIDLTETM